jgi:hypothetical protein
MAGINNEPKKTAKSMLNLISETEWSKMSVGGKFNYLDVLLNPTLTTLYAIKPVTLEFSNRLRWTWGNCTLQTRVIRLNTKVVELMDFDSVFTLLLHEFAHMLDWEWYLHRGHGPSFKKVCRDLGIPDSTYVEDRTIHRYVMRGGKRVRTHWPLTKEILEKEGLDSWFLDHWVRLPGSSGGDFKVLYYTPTRTKYPFIAMKRRDKLYSLTHDQLRYCYKVTEINES